MVIAILAVLVLTLASFVQSVVGFGAALVAMPLLLTFLDRPTAISALELQGIILSAILAATIRSPLNLRQTGTLLIAAIGGLPLGLLILIGAPLGPFKVGVGLMAIALACVALRWRTMPSGTLWAAFAGLASGILETSTTMSGPPVVLFLAGRQMEKDEFRRTLQTYFLALNIVSLPLFVAGGVINQRGVTMGAAAIPFVLAGGFLGHRVSAVVPHRHFHLIALTAVTAAGLLSVVSGLSAL